MFCNWFLSSCPEAAPSFHGDSLLHRLRCYPFLCWEKESDTEASEKLQISKENFNYSYRILIKKSKMQSVLLHSSVHLLSTCKACPV